MGTKLNSMKRIILACGVILLVSCKTSKSAVEKNTYVKEFKLTYFCDCLKHGFNNSTEVNALLKSDKSHFGELILGRKYSFIDSLAIETSKQIKLDSIQSYASRSEGTQGKKVFSKCLSEYSSKWLERLAKRAYRKRN